MTTPNTTPYGRIPEDKMRVYPIRLDPRHERIRELEFAGLFRRISPTITLKIVTRECQRMTARIYGLDDNPMPDQDRREGRVRPVPAGMTE